MLLPAKTSVCREKYFYPLKGPGPLAPRPWPAGRSAAGNWESILWESILENPSLRIHPWESILENPSLRIHPLRIHPQQSKSKKNPKYGIRWIWTQIEDPNISRPAFWSASRSESNGHSPGSTKIRTENPFGNPYGRMPKKWQWSGWSFLRLPHIYIYIYIYMAGFLSTCFGTLGHPKNSKNKSSQNGLAWSQKS